MYVELGILIGVLRGVVILVQSKRGKYFGFGSEGKIS